MEEIPFETQVEEIVAKLPADLPTEAAQLLISLDIDGTLLTETGVTEVVRSRIAKLSSAGANIIIATGRGISSTEDFLHELRLPTGWVVASNGALLLQVDAARTQVVDAALFDPAHVIDKVLAQMPGVLLGVEQEKPGTFVLEAFPEEELSGEEKIVPLNVMCHSLATKVIVRMPQMRRDEFAAEIAKIDLSDYQCFIGWSAWMDVMKKGVTKGARLEEIRGKLRISNRGTIAVGDGSNDIPMLEWAHFGVAMGDAAAEVKNAAQATTGPVEHDGAGAVLEALIRHLKLPSK